MKDTDKKLGSCTLLKMWKGFIEECEEGYQWEYGEYMNDIEVRNGIHAWMKTQKDEDFEKEVMNLDNRFVSLLIPDVFLKKYNSWWENGVLKFAGDYYVNFMKSLNITVERIK